MAKLKLRCDLCSKRLEKDKFEYLPYEKVCNFIYGDREKDHRIEQVGHGRICSECIEKYNLK